MVDQSRALALAQAAMVWGGGSSASQLKEARKEAIKKGTTSYNKEETRKSRIANKEMRIPAN